MVDCMIVQPVDAMVDSRILFVGRDRSSLHGLGVSRHGSARPGYVSGRFSGCLNGFELEAGAID